MQRGERIVRDGQLAAQAAAGLGVADHAGGKKIGHVGGERRRELHFRKFEIATQ
jgi:hypothetical protein